MRCGARGVKHGVKPYVLLAPRQHAYAPIAFISRPCVWPPPIACPEMCGEEIDYAMSHEEHAQFFAIDTTRQVDGTKQHAPAVRRGALVPHSLTTVPSAAAHPRSSECSTDGMLFLQCSDL